MPAVIGDSTEPKDVTEALQLAYSALRQAVELERKRQDQDVDPDTWAAEIHELRTMMSAAGLMTRSIGLSRLTDRVDWGTQGAPPEQPNLKPGQFLLLAEADLQAAHHHFEQAANSLTAARLKLGYLV
jgi:hypothetical protein